MGKLHLAITVILAAAGYLPGAAAAAEESARLLLPPGREARDALARLDAASLGPAEARWDPLSGSVRSLEGRFLLPGSDPARPDLTGQCRAFLAREAELFGLGEGVELELASERAGIGTRHLRFRASLAGIPVAGSEAAFHLEDPPGPDGPLLIALTTRLFPWTAGLRDPAGEALRPLISADEAVAAAQRWTSPEGRVLGSSAAALEVFPYPPPGRLTYAVRVHSVEPRGVFRVHVDARSGEVLASHDLLRYGPPAARDGRGKVFLTSPIVSQRDPSLHDMDDSAAAVPPEAYSEVVLQELDGDGGLSGPYVTTEPTPGRVRRVGLEFSFLRDADGFEEVMAYYHIDAIQRLIQELGFREVYERPIPVYANSEPPGVPYTEHQAYYLPSEVEPGTGSLSFGTGQVDAAEDPEVVAHEYGHAIQFNQAPSLSEDYFELESAAIAEGWADWLSAAYLAPLTGGYGDVCMGEWFLAADPTPAGAGAGAGAEEDLVCERRLDSPKRYPDDLVGEPHYDGEMWSSSLWRVFLALGRADALRLALQSNFYLPAGVTFDDAAEAVLRADRQLFQGSHQDFLEQVFRERGFLGPPLDLTWFYLTKHAPPARVAEDETVISKLRLVRRGRLPSAGRTIALYVNLTHPFPFALDVVLRSPAGTALRLSGQFTAGKPLVLGLRGSHPLLELLAGEPAAGVWSLEVTNFFFQEGSLSEWGLRFPGFVRGDVDQDGALAINDAIALLNHLFLRGVLDCPQAADFDDSGSLGITDAIGLLYHVVGLSAPPPLPYPGRGEDLTPDDLTCEER